jgi:imidazolonepropionase-like amidohydrolase
MRSRAVVLLSLISLCACKPTEESHMKAIVGAVLIDGLGGPPFSDSVVVTASENIREAGARSAVAIPEEADKVDGSGKFIVPALLDVYPSAEAARQNRGTIHLSNMEPAAAKTALESARDSGKRVIGHVSTQAAVRMMVDGGAIGFIGMITDTEDLDEVLVARLRDLRIFFAPALAAAGTSVEIAKHNTRRLFAAGVLIAAASNGSDLNREAELLVEAGIPPLDVIVAATRNSAAALQQLDQAGTIQAGKRADLLVLSANPGEDIRNLRKIALRMSAGAWVK